jgi:CheY-like chemotaxis protein
MIAQTNNNSSPIEFGTTGETSTNPNDAQTAPIDNCIILLFILGMSYALFTLKKIGYMADIANNGLEVLAMLENKSYDVIFMDMQMPEMDGVTTTKIIRQSTQNQPYIIALTANALEIDRQICLDIGMNDFITKPIVIAEITRVLSNYLQIHNYSKLSSNPEQEPHPQPPPRKR